MKRLISFVLGFLTFLANLFVTFIQKVKDWLSPIEKKSFAKPAMNAKIKAVAHGAKAWFYEMYSRWHIDSRQMNDEILMFN